MYGWLHRAMVDRQRFLQNHLLRLCNCDKMLRTFIHEVSVDLCKGVMVQFPVWSVPHWSGFPVGYTILNAWQMLGLDVYVPFQPSQGDKFFQYCPTLVVDVEYCCGVIQFQQNRDFHSVFSRVFSDPQWLPGVPGNLCAGSLCLPRTTLTCRSPAPGWSIQLYDQLWILRQDGFPCSNGPSECPTKPAPPCCLLTDEGKYHSSDPPFSIWRCM